MTHRWEEDHTPSLLYVTQMTSPDPTKLMSTIVALYIHLIWIQIIYGAVLGHNHINYSALHEFLVEIKGWGEGLEEYSPSEHSLKPLIFAIISIYVQLCICNWMDHQR